MPVARQAENRSVLAFSAAIASSKCGIISLSHRFGGLVSRHPEMKVTAKTVTLSTMTVREIAAPRVCPALRRESTSAVIIQLPPEPRERGMMRTNCRGCREMVRKSLGTS